MNTPEQFASLGGDLITQWAQVTERLVTFAAIFEARSGMLQFENAKFVAAEGEELTPEQVAGNAELDRLGQLALEVVTHTNLLVEWYDAGKRVRVAQNRSDF